MGTASLPPHHHQPPPGRRGEWEREAAALRAALAADCAALSAARQAAAGRLRAAVEGCLAELAMGGTRFDVRITWEPVAGGAGGSAGGSDGGAAAASDPRRLEVGDAAARGAGQARGGAFRLRAQVRFGGRVVEAQVCWVAQAE